MPGDTILFDINETILDLGALRPKFQAAFGNEAVAATWFSMLLHSSTVCVVTNTETDFADLAGIMLEAVAARLEVELSEEIRADILGSFASLAPHADVKPALTRLSSAGYRAVAFSNSSLKLITNQIDNAGLTEHFHDLISAEETGSFKPDPKVYGFAASRVSRPIDELRLVATHDWDTHGALSAGMRAAYIDRSGAPYHPRYRHPDIHGTRMDDVIERIIAGDAEN